MNEIFEAYEKKYKVKLQVKYTPIEELQENVRKSPQDIASFLHAVIGTGGTAVGSQVDNDLFPGWNPKPVVYYL